MLVPYLLRLVSSEAADGRIVGEFESIRTGQISTVRDAQELIALVQADQRRMVPPPRPPEEPS